MNKEQKTSVATEVIKNNLNDINIFQLESSGKCLIDNVTSGNTIEGPAVVIVIKK